MTVTALMSTAVTLLSICACSTTKATLPVTGQNKDGCATRVEENGTKR